MTQLKAEPDRRAGLWLKEKASDALVGLAKGVRLCGITRGQFSMLDLVRAVLATTGPAALVVSTWTTGIRDAEQAAWLLDDGAITNLLFLTDASFAQRQPVYAERMRALFGDKAVVSTEVHAKFAVILNADWAVVIRSSMNLNRNPRFEQFDVDEDAELAGFFLSFVNVVRAGIGAESWEPDRAACRKAFEDWSGGWAERPETAALVPRGGSALPTASEDKRRPEREPRTPMEIPELPDGELAGDLERAHWEAWHEAEYDLDAARADHGHTAITGLSKHLRESRILYLQARDARRAEQARFSDGSAVVERLDASFRKLPKPIQAQLLARWAPT